MRNYFSLIQEPQAAYYRQFFLQNLDLFPFEVQVIVEIFRHVYFKDSLKLTFHLSNCGNNFFVE